MIFTETNLKGAFLIKPEKIEDERGYFARSFCKWEFLKHGLNAHVVQCSVSYNKMQGTFRGMHYQLPPFEEDKIVSCVKGSVMDFIVDMRKNSPTFGQSVSVELSSENGYMLYVPRSFAHGFLTLEDDTQLFYQMTQYHQAEYATGFRFDDPAFDIRLPFEPVIISKKDKTYPTIKFEKKPVKVFI
jgi:dTDP-4-dehydrorhamnose 3,5-epimerase